MTKYNFMLLIPTSDLNEAMIKEILNQLAIKASFNIGPIPKSLASTFAPLGRMIFPISMQDMIWDALDEGDYSDFDISVYWSAKNRKDIDQNGSSQHLIAACWASIEDLSSLGNALNSSGVFVWHWHQWALIEDIEKMNLQ